MVRWVIRNDDGSLSMNATSGFEPHNMLCKAHDDWVVDELSWDGASGLVYVDPVKVALKNRTPTQVKLDAFKIQIKYATHWMDRLPLRWEVAVKATVFVALATAVYHYWPVLFHLLGL